MHVAPFQTFHALINRLIIDASMYFGLPYDHELGCEVFDNYCTKYTCIYLKASCKLLDVPPMLHRMNGMNLSPISEVIHT